jgi:antitoxin YefM
LERRQDRTGRVLYFCCACPVHLADAEYAVGMGHPPSATDQADGRWDCRPYGCTIRIVRLANTQHAATSTQLPPTDRASLPAATPAAYNFLYVAWGVAMRTMTYSETRAHFAEVLNRVADDREEVVVTRSGREDVVIVSREDYESLRETAYLLRNPANARRLLAAISRLENGGGEVHDLAHPP